MAGAPWVPLPRYTRQAHPTAEERNNWKLFGTGRGIHRHDVDEGLSIDGFLAGTKSSE